MRLEESLISSVFGLNVTPKKEIFLFFKFDPKILWTLFVSKFTLSWLDLITDFTTDKFILYFSAADKYKINLSVVKSVIKSNQERVSLLTQRIHKILGSNVRNKKISFLGVTFKPNTDDMRDSSSLKMIPYLCKKGAKVRYYDPSGEKNELKKIKNCNYRNNIKSNCNDTDLVVLLTEWDEFKSIDFKKIVKNNKFKVYDLRNLYSAEEMKKNKIKYYSVGRPNTN